MLRALRLALRSFRMWRRLFRERQGRRAIRRRPASGLASQVNGSKIG